MSFLDSSSTVEMDISPFGGGFLIIFGNMLMVIVVQYHQIALSLKFSKFETQLPKSNINFHACIPNSVRKEGLEGGHEDMAQVGV